MKIVMATPFLPTPATGGKRIMLDMIKGLCERHEMYLFSRMEPDEASDVKVLERYCKAVYPVEFETPKVRSLWNVFRIIASYRALASKVKQTVGKLDVDVVVVAFADLGFFLHKTEGTKIPWILDTYDINTLVAERKYRAAKGLWPRFFQWVAFTLTMWAETFAVKRCDLLTARSDSDARALSAIVPRTPVIAVRQFVDITDKPVARKDREPRTLLFVGAMHRPLNIMYMRYFYKEVLPLIRAKAPDVVFYLVGSGAPDEFSEWAAKDANFRMPGFVADVGAFYNKAAVFVSPILIGGGIMVKNLEAMAHGIPVVTTTLGNEGIGAKNGRDMLVADGAVDFAAAVLRLLDDPELYDALSANSIQFIRQNFDRDAVIKAMEDACREAIKRVSPGREIN